MKRPLYLAAAFALTVGTPVLAQGPAAAPQQASAQDLRELYFEIEDRYDEAYAEWRQRYSAASSAYRKARAEDPSVRFEAPAPVEPEFIGDFQRLADMGSADAQIWVIQNHRHLGLGGEAARSDMRARVLSALMGDARDEGLESLARSLGGQAMGRGAVLEKDEANALLDLMVASCPNADAAACAGYYKASALDNRRGDRAERAGAMDVYKKVAARFPDTKWGQRAGGTAFAFENLNIGQTAPEIVGQDVDGNPMKLSDFAGRVVVLDFWGFW